MKSRFDTAPFLAIWEVTRACALACSHCRASAQMDPLPGELTHLEGEKLLQEIAKMGTKIVVLSGGDPLRRKDLDDLTQIGKGLGLRMATIPAATPLLTEDRIRRLKECGVDQVALSLDFPREDLHDAFRGAPGAFGRTIHAMRWIRSAGIRLQINTTLTAHSVRYIKQMGELIASAGVSFWEVFFLVPTGRGIELPSLSAGDVESAFEELRQLDETSDVIVKVTEAPHYRRFLVRHSKKSARISEQVHRVDCGNGHIALAPEAINAGKGFVFVSFEGDVFPSGFLPLKTGNIRQRSLASIYRAHPLFQDLRNSEKLKGKCGACEYRKLCGGSRSRAYALTGDVFESDPWCVYEPAGFQRPSASSENNRNRMSTLLA